MLAQKELGINTTARLCKSIRQGKGINVILPLMQGVDIDLRDSDGNTPLLTAAIYEERDIFKLLLECGAKVMVYNQDRCTVLHYASRNGWGKIVRYLANHLYMTSKFRGLNDSDIRGNTPMHYASSSGHLEIVQFFLWETVDCNLHNCLGFTPLLCAAAESHYDVFALLCSASVIDDSNGRLLLYFAVQNNWRNVVPYLLRRVPDLNETFRMVNMPFNPSSDEHLELVKLLVGEGTITKALKMKIYRAALCSAACKGHLEVVRWLLKEVPGFRVKDHCGDKPLHSASTNGHLEIVKLLLELGTEINAKQDNGETALHGASMNGQLGIVECLLENGSDIDAKTVRGKTALHWASINGHLELVKCLVKKGSDINAECLVGSTPLLYAAKCFHKDVVALLIDLGAEVVGSSSTQCNTILICAVQNMWADIVKSLIKKVCEVDVRDSFGGTPLKFACRLKQIDIAQALLQAGARWDIEDKSGRSPFNYLFFSTKPEINLVRLLVKNGAYFKPMDYDEMVKSSSLEVLQDANLCGQAIINKFNSCDFPELYKLPVSSILPHISKMTVKSDSEVARSIERTVEFEIQTKGHCNILKVRPIALSVFSVKSVLEYCKEKNSNVQLIRPPSVIVFHPHVFLDPHNC